MEFIKKLLELLMFPSKLQVQQVKVPVKHKSKK